MTTELTVINLFGAPGVGKSGVAAGLYSLMKSCHLSAAHVTEYASYLILAGRSAQLEQEQNYLFAKQLHKQTILRGKFRYAITDSPILLSAFYGGAKESAHLHALIQESFFRFDNRNFLLTRAVGDPAVPFELTGRLHDREASIRIEGEMREYLERLNVPYEEFSVNAMTPWAILERISPDAFKYWWRQARILSAQADRRVSER